MLFRSFREESQRNTRNLSGIIKSLYSKLDGIKKTSDNVSDVIVQNNVNSKDINNSISNLNNIMSNMTTISNNIVNQLRNLTNITASGNKDFLGFFSFMKKGSASGGAFGNLLGNISKTGLMGLGLGSIANKMGGSVSSIPTPSSTTGGTDRKSTRLNSSH